MLLLKMLQRGTFIPKMGMQPIQFTLSINLIQDWNKDWNYSLMIFS
jgi:hypothetical protein